jgi:hypothetical protein
MERDKVEASRRRTARRKAFDEVGKVSVVNGPKRRPGNAPRAQHNANQFVSLAAGERMG